MLLTLCIASYLDTRLRFLQFGTTLSLLAHYKTWHVVLLLFYSERWYSFDLEPRTKCLPDRFRNGHTRIRFAVSIGVFCAFLAWCET